MFAACSGNVVLHCTIDVGHLSSSNFNQLGPSHQREDRTNSEGLPPRETMSAGFDLVLTCFQSSTLVNLCISPTRLATNVVHLREDDFIYDNVIVESVHRNVFISGMLIELITFSCNRANNTAAQSSRRGREIVFIGATLDFDINNCVLQFPVVSRVLM